MPVTRCQINVCCVSLGYDTEESSSDSGNYDTIICLIVIDSYRRGTGK